MPWVCKKCGYPVEVKFNYYYDIDENGHSNWELDHELDMYFCTNEIPKCGATDKATLSNIAEWREDTDVA